MKFILVLLALVLYVVQSSHLIVIVKDQKDFPKLNAHLGVKGLHFEPILPSNWEKSHITPTVLELAKYFYVIAPEDTLQNLQQELLQQDYIKGAYIGPDHELPVMPDTEIASVSSDTPLFVDRQIYLNPAPAGVDYKAALQRRGGRGENVVVYDVEGGWDFDHEDLIEHKGKAIYGVNVKNEGWKNHGTAVLSEIAAHDNNFGVTGIAAKTQIYGSSIYISETQQGPASKAIAEAAKVAKPGDIMLIELHRIGPEGKYIAMEWWPDNFLALKAAVEKGIIVIEAAGNGNADFTSPVYNKPQAGFPPDWKNPFNRTLADTGAILCGAGAPPPGTHGANWGPDRSRLDFSNYGPNVDAQGWGREVTSASYGDLFGRNLPRTRWYSDKFSGTSSASPIVVGVVSALQGIAKAEGKMLTPAKVRELLRKTGSPQVDAPGRPKTQRIGNRPDLKQLIAELDKM